MRILVCASEAPLAPLNGLRLQIAALTEALAAEHEVTVLAFRWPGQHGAAPAGVELLEVAPPAGGAPARLLRWARALLRREPVEAANLAAPMRAAVTTLLAQRRFDVVHVTIGLLAPVAPALGGTPAIIAPLDAWHLNVDADRAVARGPRRAALAVHARLVRRFTATAYRAYAAAVFVTAEDAGAAAAVDPRLATAVIANGVDVERFHPEPSAERDPGLIVFTGALGAASNVSAALRLAQRILPLVQRRRPDARLALVGRDPAPAVRALDGAGGVTVTGAVDDLRPWLWRAQAYACAMQSGTGIKNKLLEAMACATPCVATPLATQGIAVAAGREALVAESDAAQAEALLRLLDDAALRARIGAAARDRVVADHSWAAVAAAYVAVYRAAVTRGASHARRASSGAPAP